MYKLYSITGSCSTGIHILLNKLEQPVEIIKRDDVQDYSKIVPTNQVPALKSDNVLLTEGAAIVLHLLDKHNVDLENLGGEQEFNQWLMFNYSTLHPAYSKLFSVLGMMPDSPEKTSLMNGFAERTAQTWQVVEQRLNNRDYLVGEQVSVLDYLLAIYASWGNVFPELSIPIGKKTLQLIKKVSLLPEFKAAFEKEGASFSIPKNAY